MGTPRTAFVLAGGGSLGAVEVGMLQALVERGIAPDLVVGASVGAINGVYFAGRPDRAGVESLSAIWRGLRRGDVFPIGLVCGFLGDRKSTRLNSSHANISYAVFCLK